MSLLPSIDHIRSSEIARKFYASMRDTIQHNSTLSLDSYDSDSSIPNSNQNGSFSQRNQFNRESNIKLTQTPSFFHSIPYTGLNKKKILYILYVKISYIFFRRNDFRSLK